MREPVEKGVLVIRSGDQTSMGSCSLVGTARSTALLKGVAMWAMIWVLTVPTIFIPIFHVVSIPSGIIGAPIAGFLVWRAKLRLRAIHDGKGACPQCQGDLRFAFDDSSAKPLVGVCPKCSQQFLVEVA